MKLKWLIASAYLSAITVALIVIWFSLQRMVIVTTTAYLLIAMLILSMLLALGIATLLLRPTFKDLNALSKQSHALANGQFKRIDNIRSKTEIGSLANDFNQMSQQLELVFSQLQASERDKNDMIAQLAHDIKTPITALMAQSEALKDNMIPPVEMKRSLDNLQKQSIILNDFVDQLLQISLTTTDRELVIEPVFLDRVLLTDLQAFAVRLQIEQREPNVMLPDQLHAIQSNGQVLTRIIQNLISNALKYSPAGTPIDIRVQQDSSHTQLSVTDHGIGIAAEDQKAIFDRLYRVEQSRNLATGGLGLGLYITHALVEQLHGTIAVDSELNQGSTFTIMLPNVWSDQTPTQE